MKIHLLKIIKNTGKPACSNYFTKGRTLERQDFIQAIKNGKDCCLKCQSLIKKSELI